MKELKNIWVQFTAMFTFRKPRKFYTTYTRRMQLINQMRELKKQSVNDMRDRLNLEYK